MVNPESPQTPSSKPTNIWKWVAVGCGGTLLLAILAIVAISALVVRNLGISADPKAAEETAQQIFDYNIPGESEGLFKMNMMGIEFALVADTQVPPKVLLFVGSVPPPVIFSEIAVILVQ